MVSAPNDDSEINPRDSAAERLQREQERIHREAERLDQSKRRVLELLSREVNRIDREALRVNRERLRNEAHRQRFQRGVERERQHLLGEKHRMDKAVGRFYNYLLRMGVVDQADDTDEPDEGQG